MTLDAALLRELADELEAADHIRDQVHARLHAALNGGNEASAELQASATAERAPLSCRKCGREFPKGTGIRMHEKWCKGSPPTVLRAHGAPPTKSYLCPRCGEKFLSRDARDAHEAGHPPIPDAPTGLTGRRIGGPPVQLRGGASESEVAGA